MTAILAQATLASSVFLLPSSGLALPAHAHNYSLFSLIFRKPPPLASGLACPPGAVPLLYPDTLSTQLRGEYAHLIPEFCTSLLSIGFGYTAAALRRSRVLACDCGSPSSCAPLSVRPIMQTTLAVSFMHSVTRVPHHAAISVLLTTRDPCIAGLSWKHTCVHIKRKYV